MALLLQDAYVRPGQGLVRVQAIEPGGSRAGATPPRTPPADEETASALHSWSSRTSPQQNRWPSVVPLAYTVHPMPSRTWKPASEATSGDRRVGPPHRSSHCPRVQTPAPEALPSTRSALEAGCAAGSGSADPARRQPPSRPEASQQPIPVHHPSPDCRLVGQGWYARSNTPSTPPAAPVPSRTAAPAQIDGAFPPPAGVLLRESPFPRARAGYPRPLLSYPRQK